ncbi:MAG: M23 family metallopeptidase [Chitinispirillaceae bacterium]|nr:M23 family metallopeptidase [Chitinispirillaceae bacterium]
MTIRPVFVYLILFCLLAGTAGAGRLFWFAASFGWEKIGLHAEQCENDGLMVKIDFLGRYLSKETAGLDSLVAFEDFLRLTYGMKPISTDVRKAGVGGEPSPGEKAEVNITDPQLKKSVAVQEGLSMLLRRAQLQTTTFGETGEHVGRFHRLWSQSPSTWPTAGYVTSGFGYRTDPMSGEILFHDGLDIANRKGTPVFAPAEGVVKVSAVFQDFGNAVIISHPESGIETIYGHLDRSSVKDGQSVKRGDLIGYVGSSGKSTGPHLHYEIRKNGCSVNPVSFILPEEQIID